ncbi:MAG: leucyl/phenylalanyl-tRNA--protein transferase [Candidatus Hydrogenedentes bacterium]|nr:leucyl/phenylalanyl-tRNA--protein transferase [Candidatus Hydrogenedentota bacterium]
MPVFQLTADLVFPPPSLARHDGLLAIGGDLSERRLLLAYRMGIFPWYSEGEPILWWSPHPRLVLFPEEFHVPRRLGRVIRKGLFRVSVDSAFDEVIECCATVRQPGRESTWITPEMMRAYRKLHRSGYAHSVESWQGENLVGGIYGVSLGRCFFGESMFSLVSNASKVALAALVNLMKEWNFSFLDCQVKTAHMVRLGAREIPRRRFLQLLDKALQSETRRGFWATSCAHDHASPKVEALA